MLAMLIAINIVEGRYTFERCPRVLKKKVAEQLKSMDAEDLIKDEEYKEGA